MFKTRLQPSRRCYRGKRKPHLPPSGPEGPYSHSSTTIAERVSGKCMYGLHTFNSLNPSNNLMREVSSYCTYLAGKLRTSLVAQRIKCLPAMQKTGFDPWVGKIPWRRKWQPTPVFLRGESHGLKSLAGYSPRDHKESDMTERLHTHTHTN